MNLLTRQVSSFSRSNHPSSGSLRSHRDAGYALIVMMIMATVLLISLAAALPSVYQEAQREKEQELIFRGDQYARAIYLFHAKMGRFPMTIKELLNTNGMRFLREPYRDPMTPSGKWRYIHATATGIPIDSWTQSLTTLNPAAVPGGSESSSTTSSSPGGFGSSTSAGNSAGGIGGGSFLGSSGIGNSGSATSANGTPTKPKPSPDCVNSQVASSSPPTGEAKPILGTFIVGVASCSNHTSIMVYDKQNQYSDWEFLGTKYVVLGIPGTVAPPGLLQGPGQPNTSPGLNLGSPTSTPSGPGGSDTGFGQPTQVPQGPSGSGS
jgi:type II secretory pathway pseudopilin PulG